MIIPLGPGSLRDSSSLPEGRSNLLLRARCIRAGPALPSYLALLHAGFSVPRMLPPGRWALTPPFHPYQADGRLRRLVRFPFDPPQRRVSHRRFIFCGTFRSRALSSATPWRYQARCPNLRLSPRIHPTTFPLQDLSQSLAFRRQLGVRTFLPRFPLAKVAPAIARFIRQPNYTWKSV